MHANSAPMMKVQALLDQSPSNNFTVEQVTRCCFATSLSS